MSNQARQKEKRQQPRDFGDTLRTLMIVRVLIVTSLLGSAIFVRVLYKVTSDSFYFIIGLTFVLTLFYSLLYQALRHSRLFVFVQLLIDQFLISTLVLVTGGIESAFIILYYIPVLIAAVILGRASSLLNAFIAAVLFSTIILSANTGLIDLGYLFPFELLPMMTLLYTVFLHVSALIIVALISGNLAQVLQRTAASLRLQTRDLEHLQLINDVIVKNIGIGIFTTDVESNIRFANPFALRLLKLRENQVIKRHIYDFLEFNPDAPDALVGDEKWTREMLLKRNDSERIDVSVSRSYIIDDDLDNSGKLYIVQDMQEIKDLRRLLITKDRLAMAGEMSAAMAHEIRNPLGAISGSAQMIARSGELSEEQSYLMDIILRESERLNSTLNDHLTFTREPKFSPNLVDLSAPLRETVSLIRNSPQVTRNHTIKLDIVSDPAPMANADPSMFKQLIYNIVLNGIRAMPEGGLLSIQLENQGEWLDVTIIDEGVGVQEEMMEKMFQPFASKASGGVGLGLAIVFRIVREHGGQLMVRSLEGKGTGFKVLLPIKSRDKIEFSVSVEAADPEIWRTNGKHSDS